MRPFHSAKSCHIAALSFVFLILAGCATGNEKKELTDEQRARLFVQIAASALQENNVGGSFQALEAAEKLDPKLASIHHVRALAYFARQDVPMALKEAAKALEMDPRSPDMNNTYGKLLMDSGKPAEAIEPLKKAANETTYNEAYKPLTNLGILFYRDANWEEASFYFEKAIKSAPLVSCIAYYYRGHLKLRNRDFKGAVKDYDSATQRFCAGFSDAHLAMGIALQKNHQYDLARKKFLDVQSRFPNSKIADQAMEHLREIP